MRIFYPVTDVKNASFKRLHSAPQLATSVSIRLGTAITGGCQAHHCDGPAWLSRKDNDTVDEGLNHHTLSLHMHTSAS